MKYMSVLAKNTYFSFLKKKDFYVFLYAISYCLSCLFCFKEIDINYSTLAVDRGFKYFEHPYYLNVIYSLMAVLPAFFLSHDEKKISSYFFWLAYGLIYVPLMMLVPHFYVRPPYYVFIYNVTFLFSFLLMIFIVTYESTRLDLLLERYILSHPFFPKKNGPRKFLFDYAILGISFTFSCVLFYYYGLRDLSFLDFSKIYGIRANFHELLATSPLYLKYIFGLSSSLFAPLLVTLGYIRRNYFYMILGGMLTLYLCSISAQKTTLFFIFFQLLTFMFYQYARRYFYLIITTAPFLMLVSSVVLGFITNGNYHLYTLFTSRLIPMHAGHTYRYLEYFMTHDFFYLKESMLVRYIFGLEAPLRTIPYTIGMHFYNNPQTSANENFWIEAFANFGCGGTVLYAVIVALILKLIDAISLKKNFIFSFVLTLYPLSVLFSGSLPSTLLSGGLTVAIIVLYFSDTHD